MSNVRGIIILAFCLAGCSLEVTIDSSSLESLAPALPVNNISSFDGLSLGKPYQGYDPYGTFHLEKGADGKLVALTFPLGDSLGGADRGILRIDPTSGTLEQKGSLTGTLQSILGPNGRAMGIDGRLYFTQSQKIFRISSDFSTVDEVLSLSQSIYTVAVDSSSSVYFTVGSGVLSSLHVYKWVAGNPVVFTKQADGVTDYVFSTPQKILIDNDNKVYVYDAKSTAGVWSFTIHRFSSTGVFEQSFPLEFTDYQGNASVARDLNWDDDHTNIVAVGIPQTVATSYITPYKIAVYSKSGVLQSQHTLNVLFDGVYIAPVCTIGNEVFIGASAGIFAYHLANNTIRWVGSGGVGNGEFAGFIGVGLNAGMTVDTQDNLYVADYSNYRIQKFNSLGVYQSSVATGPLAPLGLALTKDNHLIYSGSDSQQMYSSNLVSLNGASQIVSSVTKTYGDGDDAWRDPKRIAVNSLGRRYVVDLHYTTVNGVPILPPVRVFDASGTYLSKILMPDLGGGDISVAVDIVIDSEDSVWVGKMHRVEKYDSNHTLVKTIEGFDYVAKITVDKRGYLYVVDINLTDDSLSSVKIYDETGAFVSKIDKTTPGLSGDRLRVPISVAVDSKYRIYIADSTNRIRRFTPVTAVLASEAE